MVNEKPYTEGGYSLGELEGVKLTYLFVATKLGDLIENIVVVGGLVPNLLIDQGKMGENRTDALSCHVGTRDLDIGLSLGLLEKSQYSEISKRLKRAGFANEIKDSGEPRTHRWNLKTHCLDAKIDFLISPSGEEEKGGEIKNLEEDFSAIITPGLNLAFEDCEKIQIEGEIPEGGITKRKLNVCGPAAFVILKSLAFEIRNENKDAYDLFYVLRNFEKGMDEIAARFDEFDDQQEVRHALEILERDFTEEDNIGPVSVANFIESRPQEEIRADVVAFIGDFLSKISRNRG